MFVSFPDDQFLLGRAADPGSDPWTKQPTVAGDVVNKSVSGDLLPKWQAGDNIHALPAFAFAVAPGHPRVKSRSRYCNIPTGTKRCHCDSFFHTSSWFFFAF